MAYKVKFTGIYSIYNKTTNKYYIGYSKHIRKRLERHKYELRKNIHFNNHLQNAYNKYGEDDFEFEILEECLEEYLTSQEHYWCSMLNTHNREYGYNNRPTHPHEKCKGMSEETREKQRKAHTGKKSNNNQLAALALGRKSRLGQPMHPNRLINNYKKVIDNVSGKIYNSITEAAIDLGYNMTYLSNMLTGAKKKTIDITYYKEIK